MLLVNLGSACAALGRYDDSFEYLQQALATSRAIGHRNAQAYALQSLGSTCLRLGRFEESATYCNDAVEIFRETGDQFGLGIALGRLAFSRLQQRNFADAISHLQAALGNSRDIDDQPGEAWAAEALGIALHEVGQKDVARKIWQEAVGLYGRLLDGESAMRVHAQLTNPEAPPLTPRPRP